MDAMPTTRSLWNVEAKNHKLLEPRSEELCRDHLMSLMKPRLAQRLISLDPEARYAGETRSDIRASIPVANVPVEIKRHHHPDLWTAIEEQLIAKYCRDPGCEGYGVYLVLWFGAAPRRRVPTPPEGVDAVDSAEELQRALEGIVPEEHRGLVVVRCIDCSGGAS